MLFIELLSRNPDLYLSWVTMVAFSICVHELAHAWAASSQGDSTAAREGYVTLNPLKLMGGRSLIMLAVLGFAYGQVPVNPRAMRRQWSHAFVACAGPGANVVLAFAFAALTALVRGIGTDIGQPLTLLLTTGVRANCFLVLFNMLPIPMLDGWQLYAWLFPRLTRIRQEHLGAWSLGIIVLVFVSPLGTILWNAADRLAVMVLRTALAATGAGV